MTRVDYDRLDEVLRSYGFTVREPEPDTRVYNHVPTGALLVMPIFPPHEQVHTHHLVGARVTLDRFGIASEDEFTARLQKAG